MKKINHLVAFMLSASMLTASTLIFSCKNASNNTTSDTTASSMTARTNDSAMDKMKVENPPAPKVKSKTTTLEEKPDKTQKISEDKNHIYNYSDVMPEFPGGEAALQEYVQDNVKYPSKAVDNGKEGTVYVHFAIDENGKVTDAHVQGEQLGYGLDEEALRVVDSMPDWIPGEVKGKKVKVYYTLPIIFALAK